MRTSNKVVVNAAVTGGDHVPSQSEHIPITPNKIIEEGVAAAEAGASIVHIHVRDPDTGKPVPDMDLFREIAEGIQKRSDAIVLPTTGGSINMSVEEKVRVIPELEPEMATCNLGSINYGLYPIKQTIDEYEYSWEEQFLEESRDAVFSNTFAELEALLEVCRDHGTKPELECYDVGHLYNAKHLLDRGFLDPPLQLQFVMGVLGGIGADAENLNYMVRVAEKLFGDEFSFSVIGAGRHQFALGVQAVHMGGHVRVGLEDNLYLRRGEYAESNAQLVRKMVELMYEVSGREPASPEGTREFFDLKGSRNTAFYPG
jgi:uncharacterized protein (DUF849 family)